MQVMESQKSASEVTFGKELRYFQPNALPSLTGILNPPSPQEPNTYPIPFCKTTATGG